MYNIYTNIDIHMYICIHIHTYKHIENRQEHTIGISEVAFSNSNKAHFYVKLLTHLLEFSAEYCACNRAAHNLTTNNTCGYCACEGWYLDWVLVWFCVGVCEVRRGGGRGLVYFDLEMLHSMDTCRVETAGT